jgi:hypothetical protein
MACDCAPDSCWFVDLGYVWCRPCGEHHRPPECAIDERGSALAPCGCSWDALDAEPLCQHDENDPPPEGGGSLAGLSRLSACP